MQRQPFIAAQLQLGQLCKAANCLQARQPLSTAQLHTTPTEVQALQLLQAASQGRSCSSPTPCSAYDKTKRVRRVKAVSASASPRHKLNLIIIIKLPN
jgi:hypothetical protein